MKFLKKIDDLIYLLCTRTLVVSVFAMIIFSAIGIIIRWFDFSYQWLEPLIRHLVFLTIFLGGLIATEKNTHVSIDLISRYLEKEDKKEIRKKINIFVTLVCLLVALWLIYASVNFIKIELVFGKYVFWGIHSGFLVMIIPFGFSVIAFKLFIKIMEMILKKEVVA